jgi:hypothetical protein
MKNKPGFFWRMIAFIVGFILIFLGGVTFLITTIPGIGLVVWSITGNFWESKL